MTQLNTRIAACFVALGLTCFAISHRARAVNPPPDGGYPGYNTAEGEDALFSRTDGQYNTAIGFAALHNDTTGDFNTALGSAALLSNTGDENTAVGAGALIFNTTGRENTAVGSFALIENKNGFSNTAVGDHAMESNQSGISNIAVGALAMQSNVSSLFSVAVGVGALMANQTTGNTGIGHLALSANTTGGNNTALGYQAGSALTTGDNNIDINNEGVAGESGTIRIGDSAVNTACFIAGINGATASGGTAVYVDNNGQLGTVTSSARFKENIKPMDQVSESILGLKPVSFRYKNEIDAKGTPQFGLVAEDVAKVNPALVLNDREGRPYTVRYEAVNAMLLNEFLKEHNRFIAEQRKVDKLQATVAQQQKDIEALTSGLQKISAELELSKAEPQTVLNP